MYFTCRASTAVAWKHPSTENTRLILNLAMVAVAPVVSKLWVSLVKSYHIFTDW